MSQATKVLDTVEIECPHCHLTFDLGNVSWSLLKNAKPMTFEASVLYQELSSVSGDPSTPNSDSSASISATGKPSSEAIGDGGPVPHP